MGSFQIARRIIVFAAAVVCCVTSISFASVKGENDFRNVRWGMSMDEVRQREKSRLTLTLNDMLQYDTKLAEQKVQLVYSFGNGLESASYFLKEYHISHEQYEKIFKGFVTLLEEKYGPPHEVYQMVHVDADEAMTRDLAAHASGMVRTVYSWKSERTNVNAHLYGYDGKLQVHLFYGYNRPKLDGF